MIVLYTIFYSSKFKLTYLPIGSIYGVLQSCSYSNCYFWKQSCLNLCGILLTPETIVDLQEKNLNSRLANGISVSFCIMFFFGLQISFLLLQAHWKITKNGVPNKIVHMMKHVNLQFCRTHLDGVIWKNWQLARNI